MVDYSDMFRLLFIAILRKYWYKKYRERVEICWISLLYVDKWNLLCNFLVINSFTQAYIYSTEDILYQDKYGANNFNKW